MFKMMIQMSLRASLGALFLLLAACGGDDTVATVIDADPVAITGTVSGRVLNYDTGEAVVGVSVSVGTQTTTTASDGSYNITNVPEAARVIVNTGVNGYADQSKIVSVNAIENEVLLTLSILPADYTETFDPTLTNQIADIDPNPAASTYLIDLLANSLVDSSGAPPITGNVTANAVVIDAAHDVDVMPGDFSISDGNGGLVSIETYAALSISFKDQNGNALNLANGQTATIRMPVSDRSGAPPKNLALYYYNDVSGEWVEEGTASLVGTGDSAYYQGTVSHFSTWSAARVYDRVSVSGCVIDGKGQRVSGITVKSEGGNYTGTTRTKTDSNGIFSVYAKSNAMAMVYGSSSGKKTNTVSLSTVSSDDEMSDCLVLNEVSISIKLTWGRSPVDLDAHLTGNNHHIYYANTRSLASPYFAQLDVDDTSGLGPEIITIVQSFDTRTYEYYVENFSGTYNPGMTASPARVELNVNGDVYRYSPSPGEGSSTKWRVFSLTINGDGRVTVSANKQWG